MYEYAEQYLCDELKLLFPAPTMPLPREDTLLLAMLAPCKARLELWPLLAKMCCRLTGA
jgi:hypothetical protein